ncbi:SufE family protein [Caulobacter sp. 1776]|uniref:SufE family protein n=1 Tax=Caulobacter sp. 1776 TaxID=3156420 RepID=UPI003394D1D3
MSISPLGAIDTALNDLADEFELLGDWEERYRYVIELGRDLAPLTDAERSEENKVRGCASQVWLVTEPQADGTLVFRGDSDAHIVSGLIAILLRLYSGRTPADIAAFDAKAAFDKLGLSEALSSQRSNGLKSMVGRIQRDAQATLGQATLGKTSLA